MGLRVCDYLKRKISGNKETASVLSEYSCRSDILEWKTLKIWEWIVKKYANLK